MGTVVLNEQLAIGRTNSKNDISDVPRPTFLLS